MTREEMAACVEAADEALCAVHGTAPDADMERVAIELRKTCATCELFKIRAQVGYCLQWDEIVPDDGSGFCHRWKPKS